MSDERIPVDAARWGEWVRTGADYWNMVSRSFVVFRRNSQELTRILDRPRADIGFSLKLSSDHSTDTTEFWDEVDQRLHNELASAVSLVDHTRRLLTHFEPDVPDVVASYRERNAGVMALNETRFLRDLRNYLLHYGVAPIIQSISFRQTEEVTEWNHNIKLKASRLLEWREWNRQSREYLVSFGDSDGPALRDDVVVYVSAMQELFSWLFSQRVPINTDPRVRKRFRVQSD
jgi:hypothetical protein